MSRQIVLCEYCHRIVTPKIRATPIGNMLVPPAHKNAEGKECDGVNAEAIVGWGGTDA